MKTVDGIRIIGGKWRSQLICVPEVAAVRPTPNRVRETLFNWLTPHVLDANCLDAFAGSGALGFEALSRGANRVTFIDADQRVITQLKNTAEKLKAENTQFICTHFPAILNDQQPFNLVFLDPPFRQNLIPPCLDQLINQPMLANNALIYLEAEKELGEFVLPDNLILQKHKTAGDVGYYLLRYRYCI